MTRHKKYGIKLRSMYQWHRYAGISIAIFIIMLAVTGIMLNHTEQFELDKKYIQSEWLLSHYGISPPAEINSYKAGKFWVSQWDKQLYLESHSINDINKKIIGAVFYKNMIIIATESALFAYTEESDLIEKVTGNEGVPSGIEAIGITDSKMLAVRTVNGVFTTTEDFLFWQKSPAAISVWSSQLALPANVYQNTLTLYRGNGLKLERVILDLHSGRLFGNWGIYFMDFVAILMIFLAASGFWLWTMRIIKKKQNHRHKK